MAFHPIHFFRKYQRFWMAAVLLMCMITFVLCTGMQGGMEDFFIGMFRRNRGPVVATIGGKEDPEYFAFRPMSIALVGMGASLFIGLWGLRNANGNNVIRIGGLVVGGGMLAVTGLGVYWAAQSPIHYVYSDDMRELKKGRQVANDFMRKMCDKLVFLAEERLKKIHDEKPAEGKDEAFKRRDRITQNEIIINVLEERKKRLRYFDGGVNLDDLVEFNVWLLEADRLGIVLDENKVLTLVDVELMSPLTGYYYNPHILEVMQEVRGHLSIPNLNLKYFWQALANEFRVQMAKLAMVTYQPLALYRSEEPINQFQLRHFLPRRPFDPSNEAMPPSTKPEPLDHFPYPFEHLRVPPSPAQLWEFYRKERTEANVAFVPVLAADFLSKVPAPSEAALQELFRELSKKPFDPTSEQSGLQVPARVQISWVISSPDSPKAKKYGQDMANAAIQAFAIPAALPQILSAPAMIPVIPCILGSLPNDAKEESGSPKGTKPVPDEKRISVIESVVEREYYKMNFYGRERGDRSDFNYANVPLTSGMLAVEEGILAFEAQRTPECLAAFVGALAQPDGDLTGPPAALHALLGPAKDRYGPDNYYVLLNEKEKRAEQLKKWLLAVAARDMVTTALGDGVTSALHYFVLSRDPRDLPFLDEMPSYLVPKYRKEFARQFAVEESQRTMLELRKALKEPKAQGNGLIIERVFNEPPFSKEVGKFSYERHVTDGKFLVSLRLLGKEPFKSTNPEVQQGKIKKIDLDNKLVTIDVGGGKDLNLRVLDDTRFLDADERPVKDGLKNPQFKDGVPVVFERSRELYDRYSIKLAPELKPLRDAFKERLRDGTYKWITMINIMEGRAGTDRALTEDDFDKLFFDKGETFSAAAGDKGIFFVREWPPVVTNNSGKDIASPNFFDANAPRNFTKDAKKGQPEDLFAKKLSDNHILFWISKKEEAFFPAKLDTPEELAKLENDKKKIVDEEAKNKLALEEKFKEKGKEAALAAALATLRSDTEARLSKFEIANKLQDQRELRDRVIMAWKVRKARDDARPAAKKIAEALQQFDPSKSADAVHRRAESEATQLGHTAILLNGIAPLYPKGGDDFGHAGRATRYLTKYPLPKDQFLYPLPQMPEQLLTFCNPKSPLKVEPKTPADDVRPFDKQLNELNEELFKQYQKDAEEEAKKKSELEKKFKGKPGELENALADLQRKSTAKRLVQIFTNQPRDRFYVGVLLAPPEASLTQFIQTYKDTARDPLIVEAYNGISRQTWEVMKNQLYKTRGVEIVASAEERKGFADAGAD